jgi:hypothetical protein
MQRISIEEIGRAGTHIYAVDHNTENIVTEPVRCATRCDFCLVSKFATASAQILNTLPEWMRLWEL